MEKQLSEVFGMIEATGNEQQRIWQDWHEKLSEWKQQGGYLVTVGHLMDRPICISVSFVTINGKSVLFWYATSQLVDYAMIDEWLKKNVNPVVKTDATNDHVVIHAIMRD